MEELDEGSEEHMKALERLGAYLANIQTEEMRLELQT